MRLSRSGTVRSCSFEADLEDQRMLLVYPLQFTVKGILGSQRPAKDDSEAREEEEGLAANSLEHLGVIRRSRLLSEGKTLEGVRLHSSAGISHRSQERKLASLNSAGGGSNNDGRHVDGLG
jgi:hypothetical protein